MAHPFRQRLHVVRGRHRGGVRAALELRGQQDAQSFQAQLGIAQLVADGEDLAGHPERVGDVVRSVERPAPVQQHGGERPPVPGGAGQGQRPVAERQPFRVGARGVQPVGEPGQDRGPGAAVLLAQQIERLFQERLRAGVGLHRRRQDAAVPEGRPPEQAVVPEAARDVRRLGEPLVPVRVLPGPVVRPGQLQEQFAAQLVVGPEPVQQRQRSGEVTHRDLGRDLAQRALAGQALVAGGFFGGALRGRAEVMRQLRGRDTGT